MPTFFAAFHNKQRILSHDLVHTKSIQLKNKIQRTIPPTKCRALLPLSLKKIITSQIDFTLLTSVMTYVLKNKILGVLLYPNGELL